MTSSCASVFYLHIGIPKTATTTIQYFLTLHRDALRERGVLYPKSIWNSEGSSRLHRVLGAVAEPESVPWLDGLRRSWAGNDVIGMLKQEVENDGARTVILSSEALAFMYRPQVLRELLMPYRIRVLVYLRRQDNFLASLYTQLVRSRFYCATFSEFLAQNAEGTIHLPDHSMAMSMCHYDRLLGLWAEAFGRENILPGIYGDYDLPDGLLNDVAAKAGIDISDLDAPKENTNPSMDPSVVALKRRLNGLLSSEQERVFAERIFGTLRSGRAERVLVGNEALESIKRRQAILTPYEEGNARIAADYFGGRSQLFAAPSVHDALLPDYLDKTWEDACHEDVIRIVARVVNEAALHG